jgi:hypothetical protein
VDAVDEAQRSGPGDVLVFLPGEREIREAAEALRKAHHAAGTEVLPLFARQSAQEQARVFAPSKGRRVVLATNVAETSLTVPGIRYVVDTGLARVKRYSHRNKVEQLQIEKIAQSAARQRAGRCGRVADGICFRLYDEDDFNKRPAHTDPEILRSSLAGVILRMKSLKLGEVADFPFIDAPLPRMVADGYQLLAELGAVEEAEGGAVMNLTPIGRELAKLPLDPKIGRMILAARDRGSLAEVLVIAAALSTQDPRERPPERQAAADQAHARFRGPEHEQKSEFLWFWNLWKAWEEVQRHETSSKQKAWCKTNFLSWLRLREWRDVFTQLHTLCAEHGWKENDKPASFEAIHKALLTGLLGHVGCKIEDATGPAAGSYLGARGIKFWPHPGSAIAKKAGKWIMVRRAGGYLAPVRPLPRPHRARVAGGGGRPPAQAAGLRAPLVEGQRRGAGLGARHAVRPHRVSAPRRELPRDRPGPVPRAVHPRRPGAGRDRRRPGPRHGLPGPQPAPGGRDRAPGAQVPPPRRAGGRRADPRLLRRQAAARGARHRQLRGLAQGRREEVAQAAAAVPRPADAPRRRGHHHRPLPGHLEVLGQKLKLTYLHAPARPTTA